MSDHVKTAPRRERVYSRPRAALRHLLRCAVLLLVMNYMVGIGLLLPIQGIRQVEERQGAPHGAVLARDWAPEVHRTHLVYLTASEKAVTLADAYLGIFGWMGGFGWTLDCTTGAPLYAGEMTMHRDNREGIVCYYYGRVDDPAIERVEVSVRADVYDETRETWNVVESARLTVGPEDFLMKDGRRHFLLRDVTADWPDDASRNAWVIGYDGDGNVVTELEIEEGTHSSFG